MGKPSGYRFKIQRSDDQQWYWTFIAPNNEIMCSSETMKNFSDAVHAINVIIREAAKASIINS
jgi:uncharacterized protein YegP (UPF0339 family)